MKRSACTQSNPDPAVLTRYAFGMVAPSASISSDSLCALSRIKHHQGLSEPFHRLSVFFGRSAQIRPRFRSKVSLLASLVFLARFCILPFESRIPVVKPFRSSTVYFSHVSIRDSALSTSFDTSFPGYFIPDHFHYPRYCHTSSFIRRSKLYSQASRLSMFVVPLSRRVSFPPFKSHTADCTAIIVSLQSLYTYARSSANMKVKEAVSVYYRRFD